MKKYLCCFLIICLTYNSNLKAQNNDGAVAAAALVAGLSIWKAIDTYQEYYENTAANFIITKHPNYDQFRVKLFKLSSKKMSDNGGMNVVPFSFVELKDGQPTNNRKILLMFSGSSKWNAFGVVYKEFAFKWLELEDWNKILVAYSELSSPTKDEITDNMVPIYKKVKSVSSSSGDKSAQDKIEGLKVKFLNKINYYKRNEEKTTVNIKEVSVSSFGLKLDRQVIYPFYNLKGDDYLVKDFSNEYKIIANEKSMGLYVKDQKESILIQRRLMNKIHAFLNNLEIEEEEE